MISGAGSPTAANGVRVDGSRPWVRLSGDCNRPIRAIVFGERTAGQIERVKVNIGGHGMTGKPDKELPVGAGGVNAVDEEDVSARLARLKREAVETQARFRDPEQRSTLRSGEPDAFFKWAGEMVDAKHRLTDAIMSLPEDGFQLQGATARGCMHLLNASAQRPGHWQLTRFDDKGEPWGDTQYADRRTAIKEFISDISLATLDTIDGAFTAGIDPPAPARRTRRP